MGLTAPKRLRCAGWVWYALRMSSYLTTVALRLVFTKAELDLILGWISCYRDHGCTRELDEENEALAAKFGCPESSLKP